MFKKKQITPAFNSASSISSMVEVLCPASIQFGRTEFMMDDTYAKTMTIYNYPPTVDIGWLRPLIKLGQAIVTYHCVNVSNTVLLENINRTINAERLKNKESLVETEQDSALVSVDRARQLARRLNTEGVRAVNLTISITFFAHTSDDLDKLVDGVKTQLEGYGFSLRPMGLFQKEGFIQNFPTCDDAYRALSSIDMTIDTFAGGFGFIPSAGLNDKFGRYIGHDPSYEPVFLDIWERNSSRNNSNVVITGTMGTGKSTLAKDLLLNQFAVGDKIIILDAEEEYLGLTKEYCGNIIDTSGGSSARINPLQLRDIPEAWDDMTPEQISNLSKSNLKMVQGPLSMHISFLKNWFSIYLEDITQAQLAILEKLLYLVYKEKGIDENTDPRNLAPEDFPIMEDLYNMIVRAAAKQGTSEQMHLALESLLSLLESSVHGTDRFLFNGPTTIDMSNPLTTFNVSKLLEAKANIKNAQFYNITSYCWLQMTRDNHERCILVVDEAHLFISTKNNQVFEWLSQSARRFRKYEASLWLMTQNIGDFMYENVRAFGQPLLNNPDIKFVLRQRSTDIEQLKSLFKITEGEASLIEHASRGEGLLMAGNTHLYSTIEVPQQLLTLIEQTGGGR